MTRLATKDIITLCFLNLALFVGAGNIIFPPYIGMMAGADIVPAAAGFLLTGVGLPVLAAIAIARADGSLERLTRPAGRFTGRVLTIICYLCIGPLFAAPRTATVSWELGIQVFTDTDNAGLWIYSIIYFAVVLIFSLYPAALLDTVGRYLSPLKILALLALSCSAFFLPNEEPNAPDIEWRNRAFSQGVTNGYLTLDTLGALVFGLVIVNAIRSRGIIDRLTITRYAILSGLFAGSGLILVYAGLFILGMNGSLIAPNANNGAEILNAFVQGIYGQGGSVFLGGLITLACLVTAIGVTCACASWFSEITSFSYRSLVFFFTGFSFLASCAGLSKLIELSIPALIAVYPAFITLVIASFIRPGNHPLNKVRPAVMFALVAGIADAMSNLLPSTSFSRLLSIVPLQQLGLGWLLPTMVLLGLSTLRQTLKKSI